MQGLLAYYPCDSASGSTLPDLSGNHRDATLEWSGSGRPSITAGKIGNALRLDDRNRNHVTLPSGILAGVCEVTIATWVYVNTPGDWQRIWDFGNDNKSYMFLTPAI